LQFAESKPISTYIFAFAAGRFMVEEAQRDGRAFRMLHRETDRARVDRSREAIFDLHASALRWLEDYTGIKYPFDKFDFVAVPAFQFGGMEHPGAIYYRAASLFLEESPTTNQLLGRASVIAHETAHMWFGDLVTMEWFNDVWMKEVFANFMAAKIVAPSFPQLNHDLRFLLAHHPTAYEIDRTEGANPIRQELGNLREAGSLYGAIIYQKAPVVMRQLEVLIGENSLRDGLREYLSAHSFGNATWNDLITILDRRTPENLAEWSRVWVSEPGRPRVSATVVANGDGTARELRLRQSDPLASVRGPTLWNQRVGVLFGRADSVAGVHLHLRDSVATHQLNGRMPLPDFILPGSEGLSYGHFVLDSASRRFLLAHLPGLPTAIIRSTAWIAMWESLLHNELSPGDFIDLAIRALPQESDELVVQHVLGLLDQSYWRFRSPEGRTAIAAVVEDALWSEVLREGTSARKRAFFDTYVSVALSDAAVARLRRIWEKRDSVPGVAISEEQFITLARELALRDVRGADQILREQLARVTNADRRARMEFVMPALSSNQRVRDSVFRSFANLANRRRESWVLEAQAAMNHPLRASSSVASIRAALELVHEIQRTGDIFFPQRWLGATLYGHQSVRAAETVREFLAQAGPTYPVRLRAKILQSADPLFRAAAIVARP
jgi:aminopeptidase N